MLLYDWNRVRASFPRPRKPQWFPEQWLFYEEERGRDRYACPDLYIHCGERIVCFEFKLTRCYDAVAQLRDLYMPLLGLLYRVPVVGVAAFYNPGGAYVEGADVPYTLTDCLALPSNSIAEWHYLA